MVAETAVQQELLQKMVLHRGLTRRQMADAMGVSMPAVTRHARWMATHRLVESQTRKIAGIKRPVEVLRVRKDRAFGLALLIEPDRIDAEVIDSSGVARARRVETCESATQLAVMAAVRRSCDWFERESPGGQHPGVVGLSVRGYVEPSAGMIFAMHGVPDWRPCLPAELIEGLAGSSFVPWTRAASKVHGLSARLEIDDRIGLIECSSDGLSVASMEHGRTALGRFGTASSAVHRTVSEASRRCFCGRTGCLADHIDRGDATPDMIRRALPDLTREMGVDVLGIDASLDALGAQAGQSHATRIVTVDDAESLAREGLRIATTRLLVRRLVQGLRPAPPTRITNPQALRETADSAE